MKDNVIKAVFAFTHRINDNGTYRVSFEVAIIIGLLVMLTGYMVWTAVQAIRDWWRSK